MTTKRKLVYLAAGLVAIAALILIPRRAGVSGRQLTAGFTSEFLVRPDGYSGLIDAYGFRFASEPKHMDPGLMYRAVADGAVDVICGFATDGRIPAYDLVMLEDDLGFFPPYYAAPLVRSATLKEYPELSVLLNRLEGKISTEAMRTMNYRVDEGHDRAADVAREFLVREGLVDDASSTKNETRGPIRIGGKNFTEQEILGELLAILIEENTDIAVDRRLNLGGTMICFTALQAGDLDIYVEYTGTGLVNILKEHVILDPDRAYNKVCEAFLREYNMIWARPLGFNNTYALTMRREQASKLSIRTISDLARFINMQKRGG